jgi:Inner membrane protein YgaP-like, transmembrane domain
MGTIDRVIRTVMGLAMIYFGFVDQSLIGNVAIAYIVGVFGVISIAFAFIAFCPIYTMGNISTAPTQNTNE